MDDPLPFDDLAPTRKRCSMCKQWLPIDEFHRNRRRRDGRQMRCRTCNIETNKRWYREHPDIRVKRMDETNVMAAMTTPAEFRADSGVVAAGQPLEIDLSPYAVCRIDG